MTTIALVVLDTLRKDYFDEHFGWMPGQWFDHAWSTSHGTVPAHASLFTGVYASEAGVYPRAPTFDYPGQSLAEQLQEAGYQTRGFSCNPFISEKFGFTRGFDSMERNWSSRRLDDDIFDWGNFESERYFDSVLRYPEAVWRVLRTDCDTKTSLKHGVLRKLYHDNSSLVAGDKGAAQALDHLRRMEVGDDEFFFVNLMEAHGPYIAPKKYQTVEETNDGTSFADVITFEEPRPENTRQAYEDCVRYLSDIYRDIFAELRTEFEYVITVADHGENLGENGYWGHNFGVRPELTNVPFVIWSREGGSLPTDEPVSLLDVYATVLGRAGLTPQRRGVDLFETKPTAPALTEYHGIPQPEMIDRMREAGHDEATVQRYDQWLWGIAVRPDLYGYETLDGFEATGTADVDDVTAVLEEEKDALDVRKTTENRELSDSVRDELEYLGYL